MIGFFTLVGQLRLIGAVLVTLGAGHVALPRALGWRVELAGLSVVSRQVSYAHTFFVGLTCVMLGLIPLTRPDALISGNPLGWPVLCGFIVFWGARLFFELLIFSPDIWRGSRWKTTAHFAMIGMCSWIVAVCVWAL